MENPTFIKPLRDIPYYSWTPFDSLGVVKNALRALENGDLSQAAMIVDAMRCDDRIDGCLMTRTACLPALPIIFEPGTGRKSKSVATELEDSFEMMFSDKALRELMEWWAMLGVAFGELIWTPKIDGTNLSASRWQCELKVWHPRYFYYRHDTRSYWVTHLDGTTEIQPNDGQWIVFTAGTFDRSFLYGKVRSLYMPWLLRQWSRRDAGRYSEVYGTPMRLIKTPKGADEKDKNRATREIAKIGVESVIRLPQGASKEEPGYDLSLIEATGRGFDGFLNLGREVGNDIAIALLGQNLTTEVRSGSLAAARVHENIRADILESDAELLSQCLREQALKPWAKFNFGDENLAPVIKWVTDPPGDKTQDAIFIKTLGEGIAALKAVGAKPDIDEMLEDADVPTTGPAEEVQPMDGTQPPKPGDETATQPPEQGQLSFFTHQSKPKIKGAVEGQLYVDELADSATRAGARVMVDDIHALLTVIESSSTYEQLKLNLAKAYQGMDPNKFAGVMEKALILSELAGRVTILKDL